MKQLVLGLPVGVDYSAASFLPTVGSVQARRVLEGLVPSGAAHGGRVVVLVGPVASGKSHLLHMWREQVGEEALALAVDDVHALDRVGQERLFHDLNRLKEAGGAVLVTSAVPLNEAGLLADLSSRLLAGETVFLQAPDGEELRELLVKWAGERQLHLPDAVMDYVLLRAERSAAGLHRLVVALDALSMEQKRAVTVPLVRSLLETQFAAG